MKKNIIFIGIIAVLLLTIIESFHQSGKLKQQLSTARSNIHALNTTADSLRDKNGYLYMRTETMQYEISELKEYNNDLLRRLKDVNVKPKDVEIVDNGTMEIHIHDTVYLEADDNGIYYGKWKDTWTEAYFECKDSVLKFDYKTQDSLMIVHYGQKEKFCIWHPFRKRKTSYYTIANLTRPNASVVIKSVKFK